MLVWLSPAPDQRSLSCLIKSFLSSLSHILALSHVYMCCKDQVLATGWLVWVDLVPATEVRLGVWAPLASNVSYRSQRGLSAATGASRISAYSHCGENSMCPQNQLLRGLAWVRWVRGSAPVAGAGPWVTALVPCAGCWGQGEHHPQTTCAWSMRVYSSANFKLDQLVSRRSGQGHQVGREAVLVPREHLWVWGAHGMSVWVLLVWYIKLDQLVSRGPVGGVRGPGSGQGGGDRQRDYASAQGTHKRVCACESWGCYVSACTSGLSLPIPEEERTWLSALMCDVSPVCIVCDSLCGWSRQCPLHVCVCLCVSVSCVSQRYMLNFTTCWICKRHSSSCVPEILSP